MSTDSSSLTNRFLNRSRALVALAQDAEPRQRQSLCAAAAAALDQAVCAWIAEVMDVPPPRRQQLILCGSFGAALASVGEEVSADLEELRSLRSQPGNFLSELEYCRQQDAQPPIPPMPRPQAVELLAGGGDLQPQQLNDWIDGFAAHVERGRETAWEC